VGRKILPDQTVHLFAWFSREFSSLVELPQKLEQVEDSATSVALQGTSARSGEILLLTLDARETA
jgi:hypothetical protein